MPVPLQRQLDAWLPAALFALGSAAFLGGGGRHPRIGAALGPVGSDEFFRAFAAEIHHTAGWQAMHTLILAGPVLWAVASIAAARLLAPRSSALADAGAGALLLGAAFWAVAFVLDGYVGPAHAAAVAAAGAGADRVALAAFRVSQLTMARLGMISVVLIGGAAFAFGASLLAAARGRPWPGVVGAAGLVVGAWPAVAAARGHFFPGPFTSPYWTLTALSIGLWFLALGGALPAVERPRPGSDIERLPVSEPARA